MDQNQTVDNDLQKAIDDITNTTNVDPVFSDPVAAPSSVPEGATEELSEPVGPFPEESNVQMVAPAPEPIAPLQSTTDIPELNMPTINPETEMPETLNQIETTPTTTETGQQLNTQQIKESALRDLVPLLDRLDMDASQKFGIYRDVFKDLHDHTVLEPAYKAAREITDEKERAEALLYLVESIDKM